MADLILRKDSGHVARLAPTIERICREQLADARRALRDGGWDVAGVALCLAGMAVIMYGARQA